MIFENEQTYKTLKKIFMYVFPAVMFVWESVYQIWNIPYGAAIYATIFAIWCGLGIFLGISKSKYNSAYAGFLSDGKGEDDNEQFHVS